MATAILVCLAACTEEVSTGQVWLEDLTASSGLDHRRVPEDGDATLADRMMAGVCVLDLDGEAPLDLFFSGRASGTGLYRATAPFTYEDVSDRLDLSGLDPLGCLAADLDGNGEDDLVVSSRGEVTLFSRALGVFTRSALVTAPSTHLFASVAAGDLDDDGDLDLVVAGFVDQASQPEVDCAPLPCGVRLERMEGIPNVLLVQEGGAFIDRTELAPALSLNEPTLVVSIVDLDADGAPEIYVGNDLGARFPDRLLVREGAAYLDRAVDRGLATNGRGFGMDTMGVAFGDVDGDGTLDLATTDFAGMNSSVFYCGEDRYCEERGRTMGLLRTEDTFRWGNALADLDGDGDLDLFEATGHVYTEDEARGFGYTLRRAQPPNLYEGRIAGHFARAIPTADGRSALARAYDARGLSVFDADDDGALDVVLATTRGAPALLHNVRDRADHHWLRVVLTGHAPNPSAIGARVELASATATLQRLRLAGEGYLGSFDPRLHFGLPDAGPVSLRVHWPDGTESEHAVDAVDQEVRIEQP